MSTDGTSSPWTTPASDHDEPASDGHDYRASADSATAEPAGAGEDAGDDLVSGQAAHDVVVVESVHTGDQGSAEYGAGASDVNDPAFRTTATGSTATGSTATGGAAGDWAAEPGDSALAGSAVAGSPAAGSAVAGSAAANGTTRGAGGSAADWSEIKALFVDDPSASVRRASALVERAVDGFMASLRQRQDALSSWQEGDATGTEDLRVALRGYRDLFSELERMSGQFPERSVDQPPGDQVGTAVS